MFNVCRVTLITCHLQTTDQRKLGKIWVSKAPDMSLTKKKQGFLPWVGEYSSFLYAIYKVNLQFRIKCNIRNANEMSAIDVYD